MVRAAIALWAVVVSALAGRAQGVYTATVAPNLSEDIAAPCRYELTIAQPEAAVRAVLAIFDRGPEVRAFYNDPEVYRFAARERIGLLLARHCRSKESSDIDIDPGKGLGRALFAALDQLAQSSRHGELESAKVIAFGFAAGGLLAARLPGFAPDRMLAAIAYAPGQEDRAAAQTVRLSQAAATVPQLIIANSEDAETGTQGPLEYFRPYFDKGAPWMFALQNGAPHRGVLANTKPLVFAWLESVLNPTPQTAVVSLLSSTQRGGWWLYLRTNPNDARIAKSGTKVPANHFPAGWAATRKAANEWLAFEKKPRHPVDPKYQ